MTVRRTVRLDEKLDSRLEDYTKSANIQVSEVIRRALEEFLASHAARSGETIADRLERTGLLGRFPTDVSDLSTNPKHLEGFGE
ncbi:MAG: ribbon-helix-helix domain-containing protein [Bryobacterales bacterium]